MRRISIAVFLTLSALSPLARADDPALGEFQADLVAIRPDGRTQTVCRVRAAPDKLRMEHKGKRTELVTIQRRDLGVVWTLVPDTGRYTEEALPAELFAGPLRVAGRTVETDPPVRERIGAMDCRRQPVEVPVVSMGKTGTLSATVWTWDPLPYPVRIRRPDGDVSELRNITGGAQPGGLFEIPPGYARADDIVTALRAPPPAPTNEPPPPPDAQRRPDAFNVKSYKWKFGVP